MSEKIEKNVRETGGEKPDSGKNGQETGDAAIRNALAHNISEYVTEIGEPEDTGDILLTGATGFLGIHVLRYLMDHTKKMVYCLVQKGNDTAEKQLQNMLMYYFDDPQWELFGTRIKGVEGDITDAEAMEALGTLPFQTVINCANCMFGAPLEAVNVQGMQNLVQLCTRGNRRLIQVSPVGISGTNPNGKLPAEAVLHENELDIGQSLTGTYLQSKFRAEQIVLSAVEHDGLDGKVIRIGNLMGRYSDGEFRINFVDNRYMRCLRAYAALGVVPVSVLDETVEFSPVDCTAEAVVRLASTPRSFTVFHATNGHVVQTGDVIEALFRAGVELKVVNEEAYAGALKSALSDKNLRDLVLPLSLAESRAKNVAETAVGHSNAFTTKALYRMNFKWPIIHGDYLMNAFLTLKKLDFFAV
ncbi:MAG: SDR family oxidoreductase [Eubacterium sp.]|nr:SDR family oxidoreductase [Eubacterium sp.]